MNLYNPNFSADKELRANTNVDNIVADLLSNLGPQYIYDLVSDAITVENRFRPYSGNAPNLVHSLEQNYKLLIDNFEGYSREIQEQRTNNYNQIIDILCGSFNLTFDATDFNGYPHDYYTSAYHLYSFLVSEFTVNLINFFIRYIIQERNGLYDAIEKDPGRTDPGISYSKKIIKNQKLAIIHSNIELIIRTICVADISLDTIIETLFSSSDFSRNNYLKSIIKENNSFFKEQYLPFINNDMLFASIITNIKLGLQSQIMATQYQLQPTK